MAKTKLTQLNPDAFSRFQIVCNEIKAAFSGRHIKILDIGGASTYLFDFLKANDIPFDLTIVDIVDYPGKPEEAKLIIQSAENLSFQDNTFDVVLGIDMLEHIPNIKMKRNIISEAIRVSNDLILFAGPCETYGTTEFEKDLNAQNKLLFGQDQKWLAEHFKYGKPTKELFQSSFKTANIKTRTFSALPLSDWYVSSLANLMPAVSESIPGKTVRTINAGYNERVLGQQYRIVDGSGRQEGYRSFIVGSKTGAHKSAATKQPAADQNIAFERYVDIMADGIHETKDYAALKKHLSWYMSEHERLKEENVALRAENRSLKKAVENARGPITRNAKRIRKHIQGRDTK